MTNATRQREVDGRAAIIRYHICRSCRSDYQSIEFDDDPADSSLWTH